MLLFPGNIILLPGNLLSFNKAHQKPDNQWVVYTQQPLKDPVRVMHPYRLAALREPSQMKPTDFSTGDARQQRSKQRLTVYHLTN